MPKKRTICYSFGRDRTELSSNAAIYGPFRYFDERISFSLTLKLVWLAVKKRFSLRVIKPQSTVRSIDHTMSQPNQLTHFDDQGNARMVSVSDKVATHRVAVVSGQVIMQRSTAGLITDKKFSKGDVIEIARLAGIMAAKRTSELIPLCHPIALDSVDLKLDFAPTSSTTEKYDDATATLLVSATVAAEQKTGVEMEAFTAVSIACLTVYDMCKSVDRSMRVSNIQLEHKSGGKSGDFQRTTSLNTEATSVANP